MKKSLHRAAESVTRNLFSKTSYRQRGGLVEALETRRMFDAVLPVFGTPGDDTITIDMDSNFIYASMDGVMVPQPIGLYIGLEVHCGDGNDTIEVRNTRAGKSVMIFLGNGSDQVKIAPTSGDLDDIDAGVFVPAGTDTVQDGITIFDDTDVGSDTYNVTEGFVINPALELSKGSTFKASWEEQHISAAILLNNDSNTVNIDSGVSMNGAGENLNITGGEGQGGSGGNDTVNMNGTISNGNLLRFEGGTGNDVFNVNGDVFGGSSPRIAFDGRNDTDTLNITDSAATQSYTFNATNSFVDVREGGTEVGDYQYTTLESFNITSTHATAATNFVVNGLDSNTDLNISAGAGDDSLTVGDGTITTTDFGTNVDITFDGDSGSDTVTINDSSTTSPVTHDWASGQYDHPNFGILDLTSVATATLNCGSGADIITGNAFPGPQTVVINGNGGADSFTVTPGLVDTYQLNGGSPTTVPGDTLTVNPGTSTDGTFTPNGAGAGTIDYFQRDPVIFTGMENFPTPPALSAPGAVNLDAASDSGTSSIDNITNLTSLTFSGTGAPANSTVSLYRNGIAQVHTTATATGAFTFADVAFPAGDDTYVMTAAYTDTATRFLSPFGPSLNVHVDTVAPAAPKPPAMSSLSDSGQSNTDNITNDTTPTFTGVVTAGDIVKLFNGATQIGSDSTTSGGSYSITSSALSNGVKSIQASVEDIAGNVGASSTGLSITIDTVAPAAPTLPPDLTTDTGVSTTDNITKDNTPAFNVAGPELIRLGADGAVIVDYATPGSLVSPVLPEGAHAITARSIDVAGNFSSQTAALNITIDTVAPTTTNKVFNFLTAHNLQFTFSENVQATLAVGDLSVKNQATGATVPAAEMSVAYAVATNVGTYSFPGLPNGLLSDGNYRATLSSSGVTDVAGNNLAATQLDFFVLGGDANHDGIVDVTDLGVLATNWQQSPRNSSQGDFNNDGVVDVTDLGILATHWQQGPAAPSAPVGSSQPLHSSRSIELIEPQSSADSVLD